MGKSSSANSGGLFLGEYERALDPQCRLSLPSEWRSAGDGGAFVMMPAANGAVILLPEAAFRRFFEAASDDSVADPALRKAFAYLGSRSRFCRCDKQGRMALDREILTGIGITDQLKLIGAVTHIRLCAPSGWQPSADQEDLERCLAVVRQAKADSAAICPGLPTAGSRKK